MQARYEKEMSTYVFPTDWVPPPEDPDAPPRKKGRPKKVKGDAAADADEPGSPVSKKTFNKSYTDDMDMNRHTDDSNRTSSFTWFNKLETPKIAAIESRAAAIVGCSIERVESLQVVKYKQGQFFGPHHDTGVLFDDGSVEFPSSPPRRVATFFCYLTDVPEGCGGATRFPLLKDANGNVLEVQPKKGMAVIWSDVTKDGDVDPLTVHEGAVVTKGEKYGLNIWVTD
jgi:prolyl 4-hydroxylase